MPRFFPRALLGLSLLAVAGCTVPSAQPARPPDAPRFDLPDLERRVLFAANRVRRAHGRTTLAPDSALAAIARRHSRAMTERHFFAHRDPEGRRGGDRAKLAGYAFHHFGENLFRGRLYDIVTHSRRGKDVATTYRWHTPAAFADLVVAMWMESDGHRANLLSPAFEVGGVGLATAPDDYVLVTLNLSAR